MDTVDQTPTGLEALPDDVREFAFKIAASWRKSTELIIETGRLLTEAEDSITQSQYIALRNYLASEAGISRTVISKLKMIARNPILIDPTYHDRLPPSYATLYQISKIDNAQLVTALEEGDIKATTELKDITAKFGSLTKKKEQKPKPFTTLTVSLSGDVTDISLVNIEQLREVLNTIKATKRVKVSKSGGI